VDVTHAPPGEPRLSMRPNPVRGGGEISFALESAATVRLEVADLQGRRVRTLLRGTTIAPGQRHVAWDGADDAGRPLPAGVYLIRLVTPRQVHTAKAVVMR
jgi:flagellar hook assembly protein FlgD